jgi:pilus assembly protein Flp/PilA
MNSIRNQNGQSLIEYLIIVALVAVAAIGMVKTVGYNVSVHFANISKALAGDSSELKPHKVNTVDVKARNLGEYMKGASSGVSGK